MHDCEDPARQPIKENILIEFLLFMKIIILLLASIQGWFSIANPQSLVQFSIFGKLQELKSQPWTEELNVIVLKLFHNQSKVFSNNFTSKDSSSNFCLSFWSWTFCVVITAMGFIYGFEFVRPINLWFRYIIDNIILFVKLSDLQWKACHNLAQSSLKD